MPDKPIPKELLRASLERTTGCPPLESIEDASVQSHVTGCAYCKTELAMLKSFRDAEVSPNHAVAIDQIAERLREQSFVSVKPERAETRSGPSWTARLFGGSWLRPAMLATAGILLMAGIAIQMRHREPVFDRSAARGEGAYRSGTLTIESPVGDVQNPPEEIRWQPAPNAVKYKVRLMEVDQHELWSAESSTTVITLPREVRARMAPLKTLIVEVDALGVGGNVVTHSEPARFRVLQSFYRR